MKYYNLRQVSEMLGLSVRTVRQHISDGKMKAFKYKGGKHWYVTEEEIERIRSERIDNKD